MVLKGTYGIQGVVTKFDSRESDPVYLIEQAGNEMWVPLKDIRRFEKTIKGSEKIFVVKYCCFLRTRRLTNYSNNNFMYLYKIFVLY